MFCKALFDSNVGKIEKKDTYRLISKYVVDQYLSKAALTDTILNGLIKVYAIKKNALANLSLLRIILNQFFMLDPRPYEQDFLEPFNKLLKEKRGAIQLFYQELIDIPDML